jgi:hypothetical protein
MTKSYHVQAATAEEARVRVVCGYGGIKLESEMTLVAPVPIAGEALR